MQNTMALFGSPSSTLDTILVSTVSLAIAAEISISALPLLTGTAETGVKQLSIDEDEEEEEGVKWGVMTIVSCIPLLNWLVRMPATWCLACDRVCSCRPLIVTAVHALPCNCHCHCHCHCHALPLLGAAQCMQQAVAKIP